MGGVRVLRPTKLLFLCLVSCISSQTLSFMRREGLVSVQHQLAYVYGPARLRRAHRSSHLSSGAKDDAKHSVFMRWEFLVSVNHQFAYALGPERW